MEHDGGGASFNTGTVHSLNYTSHASEHVTIDTGN